MIIWGRRFTKQYEKLPEKIREAFGERFTLFCEDPKHPLLRDHSLTGKFASFRAFSVTGDYRVIYQKTGSVYLFREIGTHSQVYD